VVLTAPELVEAQPVELFDMVEIPTELQHRVFAQRMVWREERAKSNS
jgi:hypothetical protein